LREKRQQALPTRGRHVLWRAHPTDTAKVYLKDDPRHQWNKQLQDMGPSRDIVRVTSAMVRRVEQLLIDAPNLREATLFVLGQMALARRGQCELRLPPLLLAGPPAAGKTWWAEQLAKALGVHSEVITLPSMSASFELAGGSAQWRNGTPGYIARSFLRTPLASPLFVLDEIDKPIQDNSYPVAPVLLGLIDRSSAARWRDEFFDLDFDVSRSIFVATANKPEKMDPALRSRFRRIDVCAPTRSERVAMVSSVWRQYRATRADLHLQKELPTDVIDLLAQKIDDARHLMRVLDEALGRAARRRGRLKLIAADVGGPVVRLAAWSKDANPPQRPNH
jgi:ATP-dependent Lon protease